MKNNLKFNQSLLDCHIHYPDMHMKDSLIKACDALGIQRLNIVCTPHQQRLSLVPDALHLKDHFPDRVFVFGGLDISAYFREPQRAGEILAENVTFLSQMGCDGIKMIEGKPEMRKMLPIPDFDSDILAPYWQKMDELQMPLLMHLNDPEEFWNAELVPHWAIERGWFYGDGTFVNNEDQYQQMLNVLQRHPSLKVIFAHFFFLSKQLPRLAAFLDEFPNMHIDLVPGIEMYQNFSADAQAARDFFIKYQDRILFGTDIGAKALLATPEKGIELQESSERVNLIRHFLETEGAFDLTPQSGFLFGKPNESFTGIALPENVLEKIYFQNFEKFVTKKPKPINKELVIAFCMQLEQMIKIQGSSQPGIPGDPYVAQKIRNYFQTV
ncbi:MAG: amidohydrolase family protein [Anaerolineaceae bacterium]|nr:amidohydrolase family protein [Anaerolineaceae bacterium]